MKNDISDNSIIKKPQIYYGLKTDNSVAVGKTNTEEYDYTDSKGKEYTSTYNGM